MLDIWVVDLEMDCLLLDRGWVLVREQTKVGTDPRTKAGQLAGKVEPPAWIANPDCGRQEGSTSMTRRQGDPG